MTAIDATPLIREVAANADAIDASTASPRHHLTALGHAGLLDLGIQALLDGDPTRHDLRDPAALIAGLASECMSTAFSVWAHRMATDYLARGRRTTTTDQALSDLRSGRRPGSTAMASGLKWLADLGDLTVTATPSPTGWTLSGFVPWASNLYPDAVVVLPARTPHGTIVVWVDAASIDVQPVSGLLALNATASGNLRLNDVQVSNDQVLSDDLAGFARGFRPTFLVLQTAFCVGLIQRSLAECETALDRAENSVFASELASLTTEATEHYTWWDELTRDTTTGTLADYLRVRLLASHLAGRATRLEATLAGGRGYQATSGASRRFREAAFLPVQSPSEGQLRWELSSLD